MVRCNPLPASPAPRSSRCVAPSSPSYHRTLSPAPHRPRSPRSPTPPRLPMSRAVLPPTCPGSLSLCSHAVGFAGGATPLSARLLLPDDEEVRQCGLCGVVAHAPHRPSAAVIATALCPVCAGAAWKRRASQPRDSQHEKVGNVDDHLINHRKKSRSHAGRSLMAVGAPSRFGALRAPRCEREGGFGRPSKKNCSVVFGVDVHLTFHKTPYIPFG